jgi:ABC-type branched-subunit amino acid transport system substrate-binding protein
MTISLTQKKISLLALAILIVAAGAWAGYTIIQAHTPVRIGILLPITGGNELKEPLDWAQENINRQGGIGGRPVELVYMDTGTGNTTQMAEELLADDSVRIVIGPPTSDEVFTLAPEFIKKKKLLISPLATSGGITLAFGKSGYFWRTTQSDVAQVNVIVSLLKEKGVHRVSILAENTLTGETFYDWMGFFTTEYGLNLVSIQQFDPASRNIDADVEEALQANPEYIVAACGPSDAATIKKAIDRSGKPVKLLLTDGAVSPELISSLGSAAEGIEGTSPTADPATGFSVAYEEKFSHPPTDYAASVYDALLLAAYTSARQDAAHIETPADSIQHVVSGNGTTNGWDAQAVHENLIAIQGGQTPKISGASGPLDYDRDVGVDPLVTYYSHWVIEGGDFRTIGILSATASANGESIARSRASSSHLTSISPVMGKNVPLLEKTGFEAVIVGPSMGWINYRHEADALTLYTLLRANGVPDDHIILMVYDDIPTLPENILPGNIHHIPRGANIRPGVNISYSGSRVTAATLKNVLTGTKTDSTPVVLESNASTDVFLYIVGHGTPDTIDFWNDNDTFTTDDFTNVTDTMSREKKYRQFVFMDDTCFGESIATNATAPGILYLTGASSVEPSFAAIYDMDIKQWLSDEFTSEAVGLIQENPNITFQELYTGAYTRVTGSHVQMITTGNVSTLDEPVLEFLKP